MTTHPIPTQQVLRRCAGGRAERGSAIVLVLVSMVLMAILAASLLQLTRFERIPRAESNIEIVIESVIAEILNQATDDLIDVNGDFLNIQFTNTSGGADEPWDYPWTNFNITGIRQTDDKDGNAVTGIVGGAMDDTWLADHMPDFRLGAAYPAGSLPGASGTYNNTVGVWRKITSLTGLYLGGTAGSGDLSTIASPNEYIVNFTGVNNRDMNIAANSTLLVDADGDGIGDSRWEWAPLRQIGGTQYVMAVRILDLSARMDANVSTGRFNTTSASLSRGDNPSELNGQEYVSNAAVNAGTTAGIATNEWLSVLNYRMTSNANPGATTPIGGAAETSYDSNSANPGPGTRRHLWTDGISRVSNNFRFNGEDPAGATYDYRNNTFGLTDAFELLQGGGVNSANTTTIENLMPNFLRRGGQENSYAIGSINGWTQRQFWERDPRKHMTMFSGSGSASKPMAINRDRELKLDVNEAIKTAGGRTTLRNQIDAFLTDVNNDAALLALYPHVNTRDLLANQLTANISDYIDRDNRLTVVGTRGGFEALPHITEVYIQRPYEVTAVTTLVDGSKDVEWRNAASTAGYAIEIGNPFGRYDGTSWSGRTISLENIYLKFGPYGSQSLVGDLGAPTTLAPGEVIIVSFDSAPPAASGGPRPIDDVSQLWATPTGGANIAAGGNITSTTQILGGGLTFSLHAEAQDNPGTQLTWFYSACVAEVPPGAITENLTATDGDFASVAIGDTSMIQLNYRGVGQGLEMMAVYPDPQSSNARGFADFTASFTSPSLNREDTAGTATLDNITPTFTSHAKTGASTSFGVLDGQQIVWQDNPRNRLHWIGDILQIPLIGSDLSTGVLRDRTFAQTFSDAGMGSSTNGITDMMLPYQRYSGPFASPVVNNNILSAQTSGRFGVLNYPHSTLLLEQLTTFNPATDGEDGDGQGDSATESFTNPDEDEVLVPGRLNLNTAPRATLIRLLPFPDLATRTRIADAIIQRRESMTQNTGAIAYGTGANNIPGIAYTSALFEQLENLTGAGGSASQDGIDTQTLGGAQIDLNQFEDPQGNFVNGDGISSDLDREEQLMLAKWLTEVADTRSDVFAAYIVVQGYPADNFTGGAEESARLIIIFSRSNVEGAGDKAVELGRFRIN